MGSGESEQEVSFLDRDGATAKALRKSRQESLIRSRSGSPADRMKTLRNLKESLTSEDRRQLERIDQEITKEQDRLQAKFRLNELLARY